MKGKYVNEKELYRGQWMAWKWMKLLSQCFVVVQPIDYCFDVSFFRNYIKYMQEQDCNLAPQSINVADKYLENRARRMSGVEQCAIENVVIA
ncbi:MAG: hypothetical protein ABJB16_01180 [Saprospiraceae bacterium]